MLMQLKPLKTAILSLFLLAVAPVVPAAMAQTPKPAADRIMSPADKNSVADKPDEAWQRLIYVPYRTLKNILEHPNAAAIVPLGEYLRLWDSHGPGITPVPPGAVVTEAHYAAKVEKNVVHIHATLSVHSLAKGWSEAAVRFGDAAIGNIASENNRVLVRGLGRGAYALLVPKAGTEKVELELAAPVRTSPEGKSFELECPTAGITALDVSIPEADQVVDVAPQSVVQAAGSSGSATQVKTTLPSTSRITVRWRPRTSARPETELLAGVDNLLHVTIGEGIVRTDAALSFQVFRGELRELRVAVPLGDRILDVSSPQGTIRPWKAVTEPNRQLITVELFAPLSNSNTAS